ncbi:DUF397 domain-containing protein [Streptomyces varsoviensis]|uniref:DUF397 domain-containing protein n=1 Tax=Streptomyces varsoviensis TaxID=67373 RepID=UPI0009979E42|nr:DUF397 domain-containing protein [Streptomyces varsoviensis]
MERLRRLHHRTRRLTPTKGHDTHGIVPIRDSKTPHGPVVTVSPTAWSAFVAFTAGRDA